MLPLLISASSINTLMANPLFGVILPLRMSDQVEGRRVMETCDTSRLLYEQLHLFPLGGERKPPNSNQKQRVGKDVNKGPRVLFFGAFRELALYRAEVLQTAGFGVTIAENKEEVVSILKRCDLDVAVFSYTLPSDTVLELSELLREYCADIPLITIANQRWTDRRISPTEVVLADDGPRALIAAIRRALPGG